MKRPCGFTLIELLVVIAIIAIMNAVPLPMVPLANDRSNIAICESNLRQIDLAMRMYVEDCGALPVKLEQLHAGRYLDDPAVLLCSKTGQTFWYQRTPLDAERSTVVAGCTSYPGTSKGKRPHSFRSAMMTLTLGGTVELRRD